jgi:secreted trypsin-like serine protease
VILREPFDVGVFGALPELGALDGLATRRGKQDITFEAVGYGLQGVKPELMSERDRYKAVGKLNNLRSALTDGFNMQTSNAPGIGGGTCFGDSGGPVFFNDSNVIAGVTSFGLNQNCKGNDFSYRVDIANAQDFIWSVFQ